MTKQFIFMVATSVAIVAGCGQPTVGPSETSVRAVDVSRSDEDVASETLQQMLDAAERGDWESYVDAHYGEQHKFRSPADRDALVKRFADKWGEKLLPGLSRAATLPVRIEADQAMFQDGDDTVFVLYRGDAGEWKFHL